MNLKDQVFLSQEQTARKTHAAGGAQLTIRKTRKYRWSAICARRVLWCELRRASEQRIMCVRGVRRAQQRAGSDGEKRPATSAHSQNASRFNKIQI